MAMPMCGAGTMNSKEKAFVSRPCGPQCDELKLEHSPSKDQSYPGFSSLTTVSSVFANMMPNGRAVMDAPTSMARKTVRLLC